MDINGQLYLLEKSSYKWICSGQTHVVHGFPIDHIEPTWISLHSTDYLHQEELPTDVCNLYPLCSNYLVPIQKNMYWTLICVRIVLNVSDNWHALVWLCGLLKY